MNCNGVSEVWSYATGPGYSMALGTMQSEQTACRDLVIAFRNGADVDYFVEDILRGVFRPKAGWSASFQSKYILSDLPAKFRGY